MAIEIHLPRKYSRETLEMLRNNDGPNVVMTPGAVEVDIERITNKSGLPVTKQSVLDIFNKQVIERINSLPKYSRDYYFIPTGNYGGWHDDTLHAEFVEKLGNAYLSNEYGIMAVCDYLKLSDFVDREGDITIDDLANTFTNTINKLSTLRTFSVRVTRENNYTVNFINGFAIGREQITGLVNFNEVKDKLINSTDFNTVCKEWYRKILFNAGKLYRRIDYSYVLPRVQPKDFKFFLKERNFGRPGPANEQYPGENRVQLTGIFAHSISSVYFRIPKVTSQIKQITLKINRHGGDHRHGLTIMRPMLINEKNDTIISVSKNFISENILKSIDFGSGDGRLTLEFPNNYLYNHDAATDMILTFEVTTTGDRYDASWVYIEIEEIRYETFGYGRAEYDTSDYVNGDLLAPPLKNVPISTINSEIRRSRVANGVQFKYTVKDFKRRLAEIYFVYPSGRNFNTNCEVSLEVYRNGNKIGNGVVVYNTRPWAFHSHGWDYAPIIRVSLTHPDLVVENGDELVITFNNAYVTDNAINNFRIVRVLYFPVREGWATDYNENKMVRDRVGRLNLLNGSYSSEINDYSGIKHLLREDIYQKYFNIID